MEVSSKLCILIGNRIANIWFAIYFICNSFFREMNFTPQTSLFLNNKISHHSNAENKFYKRKLWNVNDAVTSLSFFLFSFPIIIETSCFILYIIYFL